MSRKAKIELILDAAKAKREMESLKQTVQSFSTDGKTNVTELSKALKISQTEAQDLADKFKVVKISAVDAAKASILASAKQKRAYQELGDAVEDATNEGIVNFKKLASTLNTTEQEARDIASALSRAGKKGADAGKKAQSAWKSTSFTLNNVMSVAGMVLRTFGKFVGKALDVAIDRGQKFTQLNLLRTHHQWKLVKDDINNVEQATGGLVRKMDILTETSMALNSGMIQSTGELTEIIKIAQIKAAQMGLTFQDAFRRIVQGISKKEVELLDELALGMKGITEATEYYAKSIGKTTSQLTAMESKMAFQRGVLLKFKRDLEGVSLENTISQIDLLAKRTTNSLSDMGDDFGEFAEGMAKHMNEIWSNKEVENRRKEFYKKNKDGLKKHMEQIYKLERDQDIDIKDMHAYRHVWALRKARKYYDDIFNLKEKEAKHNAEILAEKAKMLVKERQFLAVQYAENSFTLQQINHIAKTRIAERMKSFDFMIESYKKNFRELYKLATGKDQAPGFLKKESTGAEKAEKGLVRYYSRLNAINSLQKVSDAETMRINFITRGLNADQVKYLTQMLDKKTEILKKTDKLYLSQHKGNKKLKTASDRKAQQEKQDRNELNKFMLDKAVKQAVEMKDIAKLEELSRSANQLEVKKVEILRIQEQIRGEISRLQEGETDAQEEIVNKEDKHNAERLKKAKEFDGKMYRIKANHLMKSADDQQSLIDIQRDVFNNFVGTEEQKLALALAFQQKKFQIIEDAAKKEKKVDNKALARKKKMKEIYIGGMEDAASAFGTFVVDAAKGDAEGAAIALGTSIQTKGEDLIAESIKNGAMALGYLAIGDIRAAPTATAAGVQFTTGSTLAATGAGLGGIFSNLGLGDSGASSSNSLQSADTAAAGTSTEKQDVNVTVKDINLFRNKYALQKANYKLGG